MRRMRMTESSRSERYRKGPNEMSVSTESSHNLKPNIALDILNS